jgi:hypothetical protein
MDCHGWSSFYTTAMTNAMIGRKQIS